MANLVRNAAAAVDSGGRIDVPTRAEPAFSVDDGRVSTANWGPFVSRAIVTEHGGSLDVRSTPGEGTTATMRLPRTPL